VQTHVGHGHAQELRGLLAQLLDVLALLADDDAGAGRLDRDVDLLRRTLDLHAAHRSLGKPFAQELTHPEIGVDVHGELLLPRIPARRPVTGDPKTYAQRIDLLTHALILLAVAHGDGDVAAALDDAGAAALGARGEPLEHRRDVDMNQRDFQLVDI